MEQRTNFLYHKDKDTKASEYIASKKTFLIFALMADTYKTIEHSAEATFTEKRSKFIGFIIPIQRVEEVKEIVDEFKKKHYDARHVCWAYMLGAERTEFRSNDDGEPSGTAGKPILGQINSNELTDVIVLVVRYFGGIKLGTGGLIVAYREAAALAIAEATIVEKTVDLQVSFMFEYPFMNDVMRIVKDMEATTLDQSFDMDCRMKLEIRKAQYDELVGRLEKVESLRFDEEEEDDEL